MHFYIYFIAFMKKSSHKTGYWIGILDFSVFGQVELLEFFKIMFMKVQQQLSGPKKNTSIYRHFMSQPALRVSASAISKTHLSIIIQEYKKEDMLLLFTGKSVKLFDRQTQAEYLSAKAALCVSKCIVRD